MRIGAFDVRVFGDFNRRVRIGHAEVKAVKLCFDRLQDGGIGIEEAETERSRIERRDSELDRFHDDFNEIDAFNFRDSFVVAEVESDASNLVVRL